MSTQINFPQHHPATGRPEPGEYADYAQADFDFISGDDAVSVLTSTAEETLHLLEPLKEEQVNGLTYEKGKWTLKEVLGHLMDDERIFAHRALVIARGDRTLLPAFDENEYVAGADFEGRSLESLLDEYRTLRQATLFFFAGMPAEAWRRKGLTNGYAATPRGLAFHIAAHELHHLRVLRERYLPLIR